MKTRNEIQDEIETVLLDINSIKTQLDLYSNTLNKDWIIRARCSLRYKQIQHQKLLRELGDVNNKNRELRIQEKLINREKNNEDNKRYERIFISVTKELVSGDVYRSIVGESEKQFKNDGDVGSDKVGFLRMFGFV